MFTLSTSCARNSTTCGGEKSLMSSEEKVSSSATLAYGKLESLQAIGQLWLTHGRFAPSLRQKLSRVTPWPNGKCLTTKHHQTFFGEQTFYLFDDVWWCLMMFHRVWTPSTIRSNKVAQFIIMFHCLGLSFWKDGGHHLMDKLLSTW